MEALPNRHEDIKLMNPPTSDGKINPLILNLTKQVCDNIKAAKIDFDNFKLFRNKKEISNSLNKDKNNLSQNFDHKNSNETFNDIFDHEISDIINDNLKLADEDSEMESITNKLRNLSTKNIIQDPTYKSNTTKIQDSGNIKSDQANKENTSRTYKSQSNIYKDDFY